MNLLYIWNDSYYSVNEERGYLLNSKYDIEFCESNSELHIKQRDDYIDGFWGDNIFDVMAVVGENGSGKTKLANCIMNTLKELNVIHTSESKIRFICVFEEKIGEETRIKIFVTDKLKDVIIKSPLDCKVYKNFECEEVKKFKFGYFTNALSLHDYMRTDNEIIFDASLGGCIRKSFKYNSGMHYIDDRKNVVLNYYEDETKKMIDFINSDLTNVKIPFALPKHAEISLNDYHVNLRYISKELDKMGEKEKKILEFKDKNKYVLEDVCDSIKEKYREDWLSYLVIHLILNLFKELCIPQTSGEDLKNEVISFLAKISEITKSLDDDILNIMRRLLNYIQHDNYKYRIDNYKSFIQWLSKISIFKEKGLDSKSAKWILGLSEDNETVKDLLVHYNNTSFAYPYLSFEFGLSTGELNFLKLFSKMAELLHRNPSDDHIVKNNFAHDVECENLFLYFDEADLSLHPKWQQKYLEWILQFITTYFKKCTVHIIIATHSPIMLSDFPQNNVLYLWEKEGKKYAGMREIKTFGSNIHTLFLDSFFLDNVGTMGAFAERKINEIANGLKNDINVESEKTLKIINSIGDDIIRNKLLQMYDSRIYMEKKVEQEEIDIDVIDATIKLIKTQINNLESTIKELEKMKGDKN